MIFPTFAGNISYLDLKIRMKTLHLEKIHPGLSIDCVVFGLHGDTLKVLILKLKHIAKWALPGGFVAATEAVDTEAVRMLKDRTGLDHIFLQQFHLFGAADRNKAADIKNFVDQQIISAAEGDILAQRFVTIGYYAVVDYAKVQAPTPDYSSEFCEWCPLQELPEMIHDHREIIARAYQVLKRDLNYQPIGYNLLPNKFTMPELQTVYETILEKKIDRRNFRRKMLSFGILIATDEVRTGGSHKAPILYKFDQKKYQDAMAG